MSRVGRNPITVPEGVTVEINGSNVLVKGAKGKLETIFNENMAIKQEDGKVIVERPNDTPKMRSLHGTTRALIANMVIGVSQGFTKSLELVGVGYRAAVNGAGLSLALGYSHPVEILPVEGITFRLEGNTKINIEGIDKFLVGQVAADIRAKRPPEPYKGKGVKYSDEVIRRKEGKKA